MTILKWVVATALAVAFVLLAVANWTPVPFKLPDGTLINPPLPVLLAIAFIAGWLPTWLVHLGTRAQLRRRLAKAGVAEAPPAPVLPPQAQPTIVPPAGA